MAISEFFQLLLHIIYNYYGKEKENYSITNV